jgi:hypothetical protein
MLKDLNVDQARFVAILARTARMQRDSILGNVSEDALGGLQPGRGEHNPTAQLGLEPVPGGAPQTRALREAVATLSQVARRELYTLMRIGQGDLAAKTWLHGLTEAEVLGEEVITAAIVEDPDLHDHIMKGLYETKLSS